MKHKIIYTLTALVLITAAFFVCKTTAPTVVKTEVISSETENPEILNMNTVTDFEATETGLTLYTKDGSGYYWEK